jgi:hypothetical protein
MKFSERTAVEKAREVAHGAMLVILGPRGEDEVREREGEYRYAEEESIGDPLRVVFGLPVPLTLQAAADEVIE